MPNQSNTALIEQALAVLQRGDLLCEVTAVGLLEQYLKSPPAPLLTIGEQIKNVYRVLSPKTHDEYLTLVEEALLQADHLVVQFEHWSAVLNAHAARGVDVSPL